MKKKLLAVVLTGLFVFGLTGIACAVQIEYNLAGGSGNVSSVDFEVDGVNVNFYALAIDSSGVWHSAPETQVNKAWNGLGVMNSPNDSSSTIDGRGWDDYLVFRFDYSVSLLGLNFGSDSWNDEFDLYVGGTGFVGQDLETNVLWTNFSLGQYESDLFAVRADQDNDNFRLKGLRVDAAAPVPEPSTFILLGAGIAGLAIYRRKKSS